MDKPISPKLLAVLAFIADCKLTPTSGDICFALKVSLTTVQGRLTKLEQLGLIKAYRQNVKGRTPRLRAADYWDLTQRGQDYIDAILAANKSAA